MPDKIHPCPALDGLVAKMLGWAPTTAKHLEGPWFWKDTGMALGLRRPKPWSSDPGEALGLLAQVNQSPLPRISDESYRTQLHKGRLSLLCRASGQYRCHSIYSAINDGNFWVDDPKWFDDPALAIVVGVLLANGVTREEIEEACRG